MSKLKVFNKAKLILLLGSLGAFTLFSGCSKRSEDSSNMIIRYIEDDKDLNELDECMGTLYELPLKEFLEAERAKAEYDMNVNRGFMIHAIVKDFYPYFNYFGVAEELTFEYLSDELILKSYDSPFDYAVDLYGEDLAKIIFYQHYSVKDFIELNQSLLKKQTIYIVKSGDTLSEIAERYNVDLDILAEVNDLCDINLIYPGDELIIPKVKEEKFENNKRR